MSGTEWNEFCVRFCVLTFFEEFCFFGAKKREEEGGEGGYELLRGKL